MAIPVEYHETALPEPWTVLGIRLRPYSLGHSILLRRFAADTDTVDSFLLGLVVCSRTYSKAVRVLYSPRLLRFAGWLIGLRLRLSGANLVECIQHFRNYIARGSEHVTFYTDDKQRRRIAAPPQAIVKVFLQKELGMSERDALEMPFGKAISEMLIARAMAGDCDLIDEQEQAELAELSKPLTPEEERALRGD